MNQATYYFSITNFLYLAKANNGKLSGYEGYYKYKIPLCPVPITEESTQTFSFKNSLIKYSTALSAAYYTPISLSYKW